jgi:AmiR/NasT family two-component response regulator
MEKKYKEYKKDWEERRVVNTAKQLLMRKYYENKKR